MQAIKQIRSLCTLSLVLLGVMLVAGPVQSSDKDPAAAALEDDTAARALLSQMADTLSKSTAFSVNVRSHHDSIQPDGQSIEFSERRKIMLWRPAHLRVEVERSDGDLSLLLFDGKTITAYKADDKIYAQVEKPGTIDATIIYLVKTLQAPFPLARMFLTTLSRDIQQWIESVRFVEEDTLTEPPSIHLAGQSVDVDFQIWVTQDENPVPLRIVLTYRNDPGQPQFRADFTDWTLAPDTDAASFTFVPPVDVEQILFLAPVQNNSLPVGQEGGKP